MRVCFITANYPPETWGGTEQLVVALARELRAAGAEVVAISGSDVVHQGDDVCEEEHDGVSITRLFKKSDEQDVDGFVRPRLLAIIRDRLTDLRPDVVHVHSFAGLGLGLGRVCEDLGIPVILTFHDLWSTCARYFRLPEGGVTCPTGIDRTPCVTCVNVALQTDPSHVAKSLSDRDDLVRADVASAGVLTTPSHTAARFVRDCLPFEGDIEVIPHGLLHAVAGMHKAAIPVAGEPLRIGTFGGLVPEKGLRELVQACGDLVAAGQKCELHIAGRWYDDSFAREISLQAKDFGLRLVDHGRFTPSDRHPARNLHLAVFPSKCQETYGLVVDEALAHRVPVVVSDCGALAERSKTPGVVVTSLEALAEVLAELVASPQRLAELRDAIPEELPTITQSAQRHLDIYRRMR